MKTIEIWMEGFMATGQSGTAQKIGEYEAVDFDDAIRQHQEKNPNHGIDKYTRESFFTDEDYENRRSNYKIWGCALFDNEADARKSFG